QHWNRQVPEVQQLAANGRTGAKLDEAAGQLRSAARWDRHLDGAAALALDPIDENRRLQTHDLLCWQAERMLTDHWASEDPDATYYRVAGQASVADAQVLAGGNRPDLNKDQKAGRLDRTVQLGTRLTAPGEFVAKWHDGSEFQAGPAALAVTDEARI